MILNSPYITGSITVTGNTTIQGSLIVTGSLSGTASLASNSNLLQGTGSVGFATTASLLEVSSSQQQISSSLLQVSSSLLTLTASYAALSSSYISLSASYNTFSGSASTRTTQIEQTYATTGSNSFRANQSITGSLVVSSTITAQTLVVQTVTSSIVYSSGSNNFGNQLANTQTFTGSVNITGSLALAGNITSNGIAVVLGSGTSSYLPKFTAASTIGNSALQDDGTNTVSLTYAGASVFSIIGNSGNSKNLYFKSNGNSNPSIRIYQDGGTDNLLIALGDGSTAPSMKLTLNSTGNLGLGVTPSAWALYKAMQVQAASIANFDTSDNSIIGSNVYYGGSPTDFRYISTGTSTMYRLNGGAHSWSTAASGTAGAAITFTQAMTLTAAGRLLINTPTESIYQLDVNGTGRISGNSTLLTLRSDAGTKAVFETTRAFGVNRNFQIAVDEYAEGQFTITPSTTQGGSGYTTPIFKLAATGAATFVSSVQANSIKLNTATSNGYFHIETSLPWGTKSNDLVNFTGYGYEGNIYTEHNYGSINWFSGAVKGASITAWRNLPADGDLFDIAFSTNPGGNNITERMRITKSGAVGIGTTNPAAPLHVVGNQYIGKLGGGGNYKQTVVGQTTAAASGTSKKIAYVGFSHSVRVYVWANQSAANGSSAIADFTTLYGASTGGTTSEASFGNVSDIVVAYDNGGSPAYTINVTLTYSGAAPTINYIVEGINHDNNIYTIA